MKTLAPNGLAMQQITVEVATRPGLASLTIVGLAGKSLVESKERIRLALRSIGVTLPATCIVVNLAPAEITKDGTHYDLPIALALLACTKYINPLPKDLLVFGELGLNGQIRRVKQAVSFAIYAKQNHLRTIFPKAVQNEVALVKNLRCYFARNLRQLVAQLQSDIRFKTSHKAVIEELKDAAGSRAVTDGRKDENAVLLDNILGQSLAKRAALIAVSGNHNLLLTGPPGVGKSLLALAIKNLMPEIDEKGQLEATSIYSSKGLLNSDQPVIRQAPFRNPHHTSSQVAMIGGGNPILPGEISLAHKGLLFLDELPLFPRPVLESLREPLQNNHITVARAKQVVTYPADFLLVGAFNPCPCGYLGSQKECSCSVAQINSYHSKLSGPMLDRFQIFVRLTSIDQLSCQKNKGEEHERARKLVENARANQYARCAKLNNLLTQDELNLIIEQNSLREPLELSMKKLQLSLRSVYSAVRVAQTIANLEQSSKITPAHIAEAISYLPPMRIG